MSRVPPLSLSRSLSHWLACGVAALGLLVACNKPVPVAKLHIHEAPKSVVIFATPKPCIRAHIGVIFPIFEEHFSQQSAWLFEEGPAAPGVIDYQAGFQASVNNQIQTSPRPMTPTQAGVAGGVGGAFGMLIQGKAEKTQAQAQEFAGLVSAAFPDLDLGRDLQDLVAKKLGEKGIAVSIQDPGTAKRTLLAFPPDEHGSLPFPADRASAPGAPADLIMFMDPFALFAAPGPLNSYAPKVVIALAVYDGHSRQFLGGRVFHNNQIMGRGCYPTYQGLKSDLQNAVPILRTKFLALAPQIVDAVTGQLGAN